MGVLATTYGAAVAAIKRLFGVAGGIATLDSSGTVPLAQLPGAVKGEATYKGAWDASTNTPTLADGTGENGDFYRTSVAGSQDLGSGSITFAIGDMVIYNGAEWEKIPAGAAGGGTSQDATSLAIAAADEGSPAGNTRGDNAVDLQTARSSASEAATGAHSVVAGGEDNTADTLYATVGGGRGNLAGDHSATVAGGNTNSADGGSATVGGGFGNEALGVGSVIPGGRYAATSRYGEFAHASSRFSATGDGQRSVIQYRKATTDAAQTELFTNGSTTRCTLASTEYLSGRLTIFARRSNGDYARWTFEDVTASRIGSGNVTVDVGGGGGSATSISPDQHTGTGSTCLVDVDPDTSNQALRVQVTGNASEDWRWHAIFDGHRGLYGS